MPGLSFDDAVEMSPPAVHGKWSAIRLQPDPVTGEVINVGVVFTPKRGKPTWKLLPNAKGFECLYGSKGVEQFGFLLKVLKEHLSETPNDMHLERLSPQLSAGPWRDTAGDSAQELLEHFYQRMVKLTCKDTTTKAETHSVNTDEFRADIYRLFNPQLREQLFRTEGVYIKGQQGKAHQLDMPVWIDHIGLFPRLTFGTMVSCQYKNNVYREAALGTACQHVWAAKQYFSERKGNGFMTILRPEAGGPGFSDADITVIENEIDDLTWTLQHQKNLTIHVVQSAREAADIVRAAAL